MLPAPSAVSLLSPFPAVPVASRLPRPRGPISERLFSCLGDNPGDLAWDPSGLEGDDEDLQLALYCCYELHYGGWAGISPEWEWEPSLLALRRGLEERFLAELGEAVGPLYDQGTAAVVPHLWQMAAGNGGPSLSGWVEAHATVDHLRELAIHRSAYQLKEADPHTWGIPRLRGPAKAVMVAIQTGEYGNGTAADMHSSMWADTMAALDLDTAPNHYIDRIPAVTLATTNLISMLGLHRRWRGALVGHLALFEMTSMIPMGRYANAFRRLGVAESACRFYDAHVEADRLHQQLAAHMVEDLIRQEPGLAPDVLFGARALDVVEARFARRVLDRWQNGSTSLLP